MANKKARNARAVNPFKRSGKDTGSLKPPAWRKVILPIVIAITILVAVAIYLCVARGNFGNNNFSIEEYDGETYYVMHGDYDGNYDIQHIDLAIEFAIKPNDEAVLEDFNTQAVMDYDEYVAFCNKWHLNQAYSERGSNYLVVAYASPYAVRIDAALAGVAYDGDVASLYIWDEPFGVAADMAAYMVVVPTNNDAIKNIRAISVVNEEEWQEVVDPASVEPEITVDKKPIIYLYPRTDTNVTVKLGRPDCLTVSYPMYSTQTGWQVLAKPSGELVNLRDGRNLYALYYEGDLLDNEFQIESDGFIVKREDVADFLEDKLARLGLNEREAEEFIVYWLPKLSESEYNYIRFATNDEINQAMPLDISPAPDTVIRVLMTYKGLDEPIDNITEQQLPDMSTRRGFTVVEWGGSEING